MITCQVESRRRRHLHKPHWSLHAEAGVAKRIRDPCSSSRQRTVQSEALRLVIRWQHYKSKQLAAIEMRGGTCGLNRYNALHLTTFYYYFKTYKRDCAITYSYRTCTRACAITQVIGRVLIYKHTYKCVLYKNTRPLYTLLRHIA